MVVRGIKWENPCKVLSTVLKTKNTSYDDDNEEDDDLMKPGARDTKIWSPPSKGLLA